MFPNARFFTRIAPAIALAIAFGTIVPAQAAPDASAVVMKNFDFSPMSMTVPVGTTVTWQNLDGEPHTVVSVDGLFRSGALDQGEKFAFKFDKPGSYRYSCSIHPKMTGTIIVK
jgi:plastocyanin